MSAILTERYQLVLTVLKEASQQCLELLSKESHSSVLYQVLNTVSRGGYIHLSELAELENLTDLKVHAWGRLILLTYVNLQETMGLINLILSTCSQGNLNSKMGVNSQNLGHRGFRCKTKMMTFLYVHTTFRPHGVSVVAFGLLEGKKK
eukprot:TRINITY_DN2900_c0_g1_i7.p1 TRINITY_DN2900_c0_g1~~TRINITY_DN2900_c0_g1_i7.p1  ORF type:complete len:149 (+),score=15.75 TRINITY_DN2900_c0_g1_i7:175-621(+)